MNMLAAMNSFDLLCLNDAATLVDAKLEFLDEQALRSADPDTDGIYDRGEYIAGFGIIACQNYITESISISGLDKEHALKLGPLHSCGHSMVTLVNAIANYWKHAPEWTNPLSRRAQLTANLINDLGVDINSSYVVVNSLYTLVRPRKHRIGFVVPFLSQWAASLYVASCSPDETQ